MFTDYHAGFRQQVSTWPENPIDIFIASLQRRAKAHNPKTAKFPPRYTPKHTPPRPLPRPPPAYTCTIADLGCGDAALAKTLAPLAGKNNLNLKIYSFDLSSKANPDLVTEADIANLPLEDSSVDVAIFCLALMGTNWVEFVEEAIRVLRVGGELWVAEIKSRFTGGSSTAAVAPEGWGENKGKIGVTKPKVVPQGDDDVIDEDEGDGYEEAAFGGNTNVPTLSPPFHPFLTALSRRGLVLRAADESNKMFVRMEFFKARPPTATDTRGGEDPEYDFREVTRAGRGGGRGGRGDFGERGSRGGRGDTRGGRGGSRGGKAGGGKKWMAETADEVRTREGALLKPCVYKLR